VQPAMLVEPIVHLEHDADMKRGWELHHRAARWV